ncbi:sugar transferase, partial [Kerstersia gyiorum]|uniref:sugar transferase n=1 Tax=Kerstersia gyiorum TaxID=206506 RepID=UPI00209E5812
LASRAYVSTYLSGHVCSSISGSHSRWVRRTVTNKHQYRRHEMRPGITGWAQINGRNAISWKEKFNLDVWYIDNHSLLLDLKILILTLKKVLIKEGINADAKTTMTRFTGNEK